jgi:hypothetical protein
MNGQILFAKYAFAPNKLYFCGPNSSRTIFEYAAIGKSDRGLLPLLEQFEGAFPYLQLIAQENKIQNPFNWHVVEAYWLGNDLLNNIQIRSFYAHLADRFQKRAKLKNWAKLEKKFSFSPKPNHLFHVLEIYHLIGTIRGGQITTLMNHINQCRISWGKIIKINKDKLFVETREIETLNNKLILGTPQEKEINYQFRDQSFIKNINIGDWISIHWNWACDILDQRQLANLKKYTLLNLKFANLTI